MPEIKPNSSGIPGELCDILLTNNARQWCYHTVAVSLLLTFYLSDFSFLLKSFGSMVLLVLFLLAIVYSVSLVSSTQQNLQNMTQTSPERLPQRLVIYANDVISIHQCSKSTAARKIQEARDYHGKQNHHLLTIAEYCSCFDLDFNETITFLKLWQ